MGTITVVNLSNAPIQSKISNTGSIYSGINGVLENTYYHHRAANGTGFTVEANWYIPGVTIPYASSDLSNLGWFLGAAFLTGVGIIMTFATLGGTAAPLAAAEAALIASIGAAGGDAVLIASAYWAYTLACGAATLATGTSVALALASGAYATIQPIVIFVRSLESATVPETIWGQSNDYLKFTGQLPLRVKQDGNVEVDHDLLSNNPLRSAGKLTEDEFDAMRKTGQIYQIRHLRRDVVLGDHTIPKGEFADFTQGLLRTNLRAGGSPARQVDHQAHSLDVSRIFRINLAAVGSSAENNQDSTARQSVLSAGMDEDDYRVYLKHVDSPEVTRSMSCSYWQLVPTREHGGGWLILDRRYCRFVCLSGNEILQQQSDDVGGLALKDGWAVDVAKPEMVWQLEKTSTGHTRIMRRNQEQKTIYITARTDGGFPIYARELNEGDVYQSWELEAIAT